MFSNDDYLICFLYIFFCFDMNYRVDLLSEYMVVISVKLHSVRMIMRMTTIAYKSHLILMTYLVVI
jgi:hypothetical protein